MGRRVLIVDGYNVIRMTPPYSVLAEVDLESARTALLSDVAAYAMGVWDATIVFDGGANPQSDGLPHLTLGVTVIFSKYGMEADTVIELLSRVARTRGDTVEVVTSDAQTQWTVLGGGVVRRSSGEFADSLRSTEGEWREHMTTGGTRERIEDRIDPEVTARLARWARGGS
jgi:predicted RNA-binding protein with PIN domain